MQHYLDNSATTRVSPTVSDKVVELMQDNFGNPSSLHSLGIRAENELEKARGIIARHRGQQSGNIRNGGMAQTARKQNRYNRR